MDRGQDLFPAERAKASAEAQLSEGEKKPRAKKIPAGQPGLQARRECDLNRLYDSEKVGRSGKCTYYQLHNRPPATSHQLQNFMVLYSLQGVLAPGVLL